MNAKPAKTTAQALAIGETIRKSALGYAAKTGTAIDLVVVKAADAKHEFSLATPNLYRAIKGNLSPEEVENLPLPGSRWNDLEDGSNVLADMFQWKDPSKPDSKPREVSFYVVWSDNTPEGKHVVQELEYCSRVSTEGMKTDDIPADWLKKYDANPQLVKKRRKYLEGRRGTIRKAYKDAVRLIWQIDMVNELSGCGCELGEGDDNTVTVFNKHKPRGEWRVFSVGAFLKLKPAKASEQGGSYDALIATAERGKKPGGGDKNKVSINSVQTPETAATVGLMFAHYLDRAFSNRASPEYADLLKHITTTEPGKQTAHTMLTIYNRLGSLFRIDQVKAIADAEADKVGRAA
jgi:hypothetical protein